MGAQNPDKHEIDFFSLVFFLWRKRNFIAIGTVVFTLLGAAKAMLAAEVYQADALIAVRDNQSSGSAGGILGQLGGIGGAMAGQFGMLNSNLDKMEIVLRGRELAQAVIRKNDLMPRMYPGDWDAAAKKWKGGTKRVPNERNAIEHLRSGILKVTPDPRKKMLRIFATTSDSTTCYEIINFYLEALNAKLRDDTRHDADGNRQYLEKQLETIQDPLLRERIQNLMAVEIERSMLVSAKAFDLLEGPVVPSDRLAPKRRQIVMIAFALGMVLSAIGAIAWQAMQDRLRR